MTRFEHIRGNPSAVSHETDVAGRDRSYNRAMRSGLALLVVLATALGCRAEKPRLGVAGMTLGMTRQEVKSALHLDSIIHGFEPEMIYPSDSVTGEPTAPEAPRDHKADELNWEVAEPVGRGGQLMVEVAIRKPAALLNTTS